MPKGASDPDQLGGYFLKARELLRLHDQREGTPLPERVTTNREGTWRRKGTPRSRWGPHTRGGVAIPIQVSFGFSPVQSTGSVSWALSTRTPHNPTQPPFGRERSSHPPNS